MTPSILIVEDEPEVRSLVEYTLAKEKYKVQTAGNAEGAKAEVLAELAALIAAGRLEIPITRAYLLTDVRNAYRELEKHHTLGKIVLVP